MEGFKVMQKRILALLIAAMMMIGVCGCMRRNRDSVNKPNEQEYTEQMRKYMEDAYDTTFTVVETIFPKSGFNTGMLENVVVLKDSQGVVTNVKARLGNPDAFYDDYANCLGAHKIQNNMDLAVLQEMGNARVYAVVRDKNIADISIAADNVSSVTLVVNIPCEPSEAAMECLYDAYGQLCEAGYQTLYLIAWFTDGDAEFDRAVENYRVYGKPDWSHYSGTVYAALKISAPDVSYEDFRAALIDNR